MAEKCPECGEDAPCEATAIPMCLECGSDALDWLKAENARLKAIVDKLREAALFAWDAFFADVLDGGKTLVSAMAYLREAAEAAKNS